MNINKSIRPTIVLTAIIFSLMMSSVLFTGVSDASTDVDDTDEYYICIEKHTIGQGFIVEPTKITAPSEQNLAHALDELLTKNGLDYKNTGSLDSGFYLAAIDDKNGSLTADFPAVIVDAAGSELSETRANSFLGEFDYYNMSGWMYCVDNVFPNYGMSDCNPENGDVVRLRFTVYGYGSDLGSTFGGSTSIVPSIDCDKVVRLLADINCSGDKEELLKDKTFKEAYDAAMDAMAYISDTPDKATQQANVDKAYADLSEAYEHPVEDSDDNVLFYAVVTAILIVLIVGIVFIVIKRRTDN